MQIFNRQSVIYGELKTLINASVELAGYTKFYQESIDVEEYLPALVTYVKSDSPVNPEEQTTIGNHSRVFHLNIRILLKSANTESLESVADKVYSLVYAFGDQSNQILMIQNPSLTYQFEESNNYQVADLEIPVTYKV